MNAPLMKEQFTPDDLLRMEGGYELLDGRLVEKPMGIKASIVASNLHSLLGPFVRANSLGDVIDSEGGYELFEGRSRVRKPDVSFVRRGRFPGDEPPEGWSRVPPDFVAEVVSPNDEAEKALSKVLEWLQTGARLVWLISPGSRAVFVFRAGGGAAWFGAGGQLSGEDVIPGFLCPVDALFVRT